MGREASGQLELDLWGLSPTAADEQIAAGQQDQPEEPLDARLTVETLHAQHPPPATRAPAERPTPPSFMPAARRARESRKTPGMSL